ncbi:DNA-directed RNA polymerase III subunit RPC8 [Metschnikowia aff. pulcherrima]|uniref:DNA-directed RNA polymerase subunit n=2 Tax=Metschnikowia TaxID=27320 RepID=A0A4P6XKE6_9ASCO|nr:hypothetical protein HF325_002382 [Metschnikowia pulcherrima]QBM86141.1 DNA-directed RNA polymerase III subunit RPC8 [Metschnikowia aff. pulcherrima]
MFILSQISDLVRIPPQSFNMPLHHVLKNELHQKYSNKVITNVGLAVAVWDILEIKDGLLRPGDGGSYVEVKFRMVVWKPFIGEILCGWVADCSPEGIKVRMEFFQEIFIPKDYLFESCIYKPVEKAWVWKPDEESELFLDINEKIRFRVEEEIFVNIKPQSSSEALGLDDTSNKAPPYALIASCQTDGMGCVSWWD